MRKRTTLFLATFALSAMTGACFADQAGSAADSGASANQLDNFFVDGNIGKSEYRGATASGSPNYHSPLDPNGNVFENIRFGWRWDDVVGPEIGFANIGKGKHVRTYGEDVINGAPYRFESIYALQVQALTVGLNGRYEFYPRWFLTAHAGWLRSYTTASYLEPIYTCAIACVENTSYSNKSYGNGWYAGAGVGYDLTNRLGISLNYDDYNVKYNAESLSSLPAIDARRGINAFSVALEYRF